MAAETITPSNLPDWLLGRGRHFVTTAEISELLGVPQQTVATSLHRPRRANKIVSVTKGGWVPVPPTHRSAGAPPPIDYIDQMMRFLDHAYYVGFLSAARMHGASHQVPMVLQIVTPARLRDRRIGRHRIQYIRRANAATRPVELRDTETGRITVATTETTVLDVVNAPQHAAGLGNVGNVLGELLLENRLDTTRLAEDAVDYPTVVTQRVGWLLEYMAAEVGTTVDLSPLQELVGSLDYTLLDPRLADAGPRNDHWRVILNTDVEHDL
ncbi:MAG: type IV toxin-antitoxin system AbiEi family antitoxin [Microthrixaceae bacterium]